jgi:hypothetical protein
MLDESPTPPNSSTVCKNLRRRDRTDGSRSGHYSREDVLDACHAEGGDSHE